LEKERLLEHYRRFMTMEFELSETYQGDDLGAVWTEEETRFRVWAPTAEQVVVNLYKTGERSDLFQNISMRKASGGTWAIAVKGNLHGVYYTYSVTVDHETKEAVDPYARAVGVNGNRGMVIDLSATNPTGFRSETKPEFLQPTDAVIYELHIRDFSIDSNSGMIHKGKYLAFTEPGAKNSYGDATGIDYLKQLGITHVHLLPAFDYMTVDETQLQSPQYNWGYDPQNYNVPEGSYSTDPYHGEVRIREFKQMVQSLHQHGIRVILDVVYNHTKESINSNFNCIVPGYYYRLTPEGDFSNASGCGNETASERVMMRKFIIDSLLYWNREYHIDGFRFDLMGIHDLKTMNEIRKALDTVEKGILIYGEGWTGGLSPLPDRERAMKDNIRNMRNGIAVFNDNLRDGIKGNVFQPEEKGYITGKDGLEDTIKFGVVAATWHDWIDYSKVLGTSYPWAGEPSQVVNYASAHDNYTLWDKIILSTPFDSREDRVKRNLLSAAIILTSQGIPFFQAGEEFLRSKPLNEEKTRFEGNSYSSPDSINSLKWDQVTENKVVVDYYRGLIEFRKAHSVLRMTTAVEVEARLRFLKWLDNNLIAFLLSHPTEGEMCVIYNANNSWKPVHVPDGNWRVYIKGNRAGNKVLDSNTGGVIHVEPISAMIMVR
jgi:pullulanase